MCWRRLLFLNVQVRVAVNVHTKATVRYIRMKSDAAHAQQKQLQLQRVRHKAARGGCISTILATNSLLLLLLSLCCDLCKSTEFPTPMPPEPSDKYLNTNLNGTKFVYSNITKAATTTGTDVSHTDSGDFVTLLESITRDGLQRCIAEENIFQDEFGISCDMGDTNEKCYRTRCIKGYEEWWRALKEFESCQEACSSTRFHPYDLPCISACETAQRQYWQAQRRTMEVTVRITQPQLLVDKGDDTTTAMNSLQLKWPIVFPDNYELAHLASRPFNIQYQYAKNENETMNIEANSNDVWTTLADYNCNDYFECEILEGLVSYTSYRFRFELPFGDTPEDVIYSPATDVYTTPPSGTPISEPSITYTLPLDDSHVAFFWKPGRFSNGVLEGYKLVLQSDILNESIAQTIPPHLNQYIVGNLTPSTNYSLQLALLNGEGEGPPGEVYFTTKDIPKAFISLENLKDVLIAGEYNIKLKSLEPLGEARVVFQSEELLSDYSFYSAQQRLFALDSLGFLYSLFLNDTTERVVIQTDQLKFKPSKISVDWLNERLILAGKSLFKTWTIGTLSFDGSSTNILINNLTSPVQQLEVDPVNGWIFWIDSTGLCRLNMASKETQTILNNENSQIGYLTNDNKRYLLTVYNKTDDRIYEVSYDGAYYGSEQYATRTHLLHGELLSYQFDYDNNLYVANNGTHLLRQNYRTNENDIWDIRELEWCWHALVLQLREQPQESPTGMLRSPGELNAVLNAHVAHISWSAPAQIPAYQSVNGSWQRWEYELEIMDVASNSAFNIRNIKTTFFNVERLQANNLYKLRVRVASNTNQRANQHAAIGGNVGGTGMAEGGDGPWSEELLTRTWPLGAHKFMWICQNDKENGSGATLYESNELGDQVTHVRELMGVTLVRDFIQLNGTIYYLTEAPERRLACANIMNPEVNCAFSAQNANSLAYDWRGRKLYWTDVLRNCVVRSNLDGGERELLPILGAQYIKLDALNGHIYYMTSTKLARRSLSGSHSHTDAVDELEYFHVNGGFGGQMRGFALDLSKQQLYWIVRQNEGRVRLFKTGFDRQHGKLEDKLLEHDIAFGSLEYLAEIDALMWLREDSTAAELMRTDDLRIQSTIATGTLGCKVSVVRLKTDLTPYMDESVIPQQINSSSVRIEDGFWDDFNIKWAPIATVENFTVFYKVLLEYEELNYLKLQTYEVWEPILRITEMKEPAIVLNISIKPYTYWRGGESSHVQLMTPAAAPTQPKRLRVFVESIERPLQVVPNITALIRWDVAENLSRTNDMTYKVFCWLGEELHSEHLQNISKGKPLEAVVDKLREGETYTFQVQAFAAGRPSGGEKTAVHGLHVNPEVQGVPRLLLATSDHIGLLDMDLNSQQILVHTSSEVEHLATMHGEQRLLWVNENVELLSFIPGSAPVKLARMRAEVLALTVDWIARIVYWAELATEVEHAVDIYKLDLGQFEGRVKYGSKLLTTERGRLLRDLIVLPFSQTLIWLEFELGARNATLVGRNLTDLSALKLKGNNGLRRMFAGALTADVETVNLVDHKQRICVFDIQRQLCTPMKSSLLIEGSTQIERDNGYIYVLKNDTLRVYNRRKLNLEYLLDVPDVRRIKAFNHQAYPERKCLLPEEERLLNNTVLLRPKVIDFEEDFITLSMPAVNAHAECRLPPPGLRYNVQLNNSHNETRNFTISENFLNITELQPYTDYTADVTITSYYQQKLDLAVLKSDTIRLRTAPGTPSYPENFTAYALSPTEIEVNWDAPTELNCAKVWYELHWQMGNSSLVAHKRVEVPDIHVLTNLMPAEEYTIWLQVYSTNKKFNSTAPLLVRTYEQPKPLQVVAYTAYNLTITWEPTSDVSNVVLVCRSLNNAEENEFSVDITKNTTNIVVPNLKPKTRYEIFLELTYPDVPRPYLWPELFDERYIYETLGDSPSSPGRPRIEHITGEIFKVFWEPSESNGSPILEYSLEALQARKPRRMRRAAIDEANTTNTTRGRNNSITNLLSQMLWAEEPTPIEDKWLVQCNTIELSCIVRDVHTQRLFMFRVRARNAAYGWGSYSNNSEHISEPFVSPEKRDSLIFAIIAPAAIVSSCVIALVVIRMIQQRRRKAKKFLEKSRPSVWSNLSTLQQQQLMTSRHRTFSLASHSTLYTGGPLSDADIALLPHISWNRITLLNFLGSGAFGEVYEGLVKHEDHEETEKVAIKSLRKGSSEFAELLQEAQLMSNFKHENIVRLIGVCFDSDFISIIMEHMEGGDLLSYLRESRPNSNKPVASLQLLDLMTMCIDVANGCSYLEDMHFVHRDLACRNCLVSSRVPSKRTVKIGDFGLARDIYKNDYYRKEGNALMPVRWMSPESLVDGVFTMQSDVWAFAVLCWEILTLGQQPYAARNNMEVLNFVKDGGRLEQPDNCPDKFFSLMLECWQTDPDERPSFRKCVNTLLAIKTDVRRVSLGYNMDDSDYAMYANQHGIYMSTFLARPLPKVEEETVDIASKSSDAETTTTTETIVNDKSEFRVRFEQVPLKDIDSASISATLQLIECSNMNGHKGENCKGQEVEENIYANEGVSRL